MNLAIGDAFNLGWKLALVATWQARAASRLLRGGALPDCQGVLRGSDRGFALETIKPRLRDGSELTSRPAWSDR